MTRVCVAATTLACLFVVGCRAPGGIDRDAIERELAAPIFSAQESAREQLLLLQREHADRAKGRTTPATPAAASELRRRLREQVFEQGAVAELAKQPLQVRDVGVVERGDHAIRKLQVEVVPGMVVPALLYEPRPLPSTPAPGVVSFMGHASAGSVSAEVHQVRAIHLARQGLTVLAVEFFGNGELSAAPYWHLTLAQLDLLGNQGVSLMYVTMRRALDVLASRPGVDLTRLAATGLSGGGWQAMILAALDERVSLANPVAGFGSMESVSRSLSDLGDLEQSPPRLFALADYADIAALIAPRRLMLTYNEPDSCCFGAKRTIPPLKANLEPAYAAFGAADRLTFHVNTKPGTHNFEADNRAAFYRQLIGAGYVADKPFSTDEAGSIAAVLSPTALIVGLPKDNLTIQDLALKVSNDVQKPVVPTRREDVPKWRKERRRALENLLHVDDVDAKVVVKATQSIGDIKVRQTRISIGGLTLPATDFEPSGSRHAVVVLCDAGRKEATDVVLEVLRSGKRAIAIDLPSFGELKHKYASALLALAFGAYDRPFMGIELGELRAVARWLRSDGAETVDVHARGARVASIAVFAAALDEGELSGLVLEQGRLSVRELIEAGRSVFKRPEQFVFGIARDFDMSVLLSLALPRSIKIRDSKFRTEERAPVEAFAELIGTQPPEVDRTQIRTTVANDVSDEPARQGGDASASEQTGSALR